jgi:UDP-glucose 4-epimerase
VIDAAAFDVLAAETPSVDSVFNAGYGASMSILQLAQEIIRVTGSSSTIEFQPVRSGDIRHSTADVSKLLAAGWKPAYDVARGLELLAAP